jgi:hypothetical protein
VAELLISLFFAPLKIMSYSLRKKKEKTEEKEVRSFSLDDQNI